MFDTDHQAYKLLPASHFSANELADIYNAGRVDYIVPMLTDAESLRRYVHTYDVDLDASVVILDLEQRPAGIGMLGIRNERGWITRLGIIPERRQGGMGMGMMQALIAAARMRNARLIQLEVIEGNEPAQRLFLRCGFREIRRLMVVRRSVVAVPDDPSVAGMSVSPLSQDEIWARLAKRDSGESWVNENASLAKFERLQGVRVTSASGYEGWIIYQCKNFELTHVVLQPSGLEHQHMMIALLYHVHRLHPEHTTKIENVPAAEIWRTTLQQFNYIEEFRRIEMFLNL